MSGSKLTTEEKLRRFLFTRSFENKYTTGDVDKTFKSTKCAQETDTRVQAKTELDEIVGKNLKELLNIITQASNDNLLPKRLTMFYILAKAITSECIPADKKHEVSECVLKICKSDEDFFEFVKYCAMLCRCKQRKLSKSILKCIRKYYQKKTPLELANSYAQFHGNKGWTHKDLIKLSHVKPDSPLKTVVINYILFRKSDDSTEENKQLLNIMKNSILVRKTSSEVVAVPILKDLNLPVHQLSPELHKNAEVWNAVLPQMSTQEILRWLPKLYKLNLLKANVSTQAKVVEVLNDTERIKASKIHPVEVFIHIKNYEKGGKPMDSKLIHHLVTEKKISEEELTKLKARVEPKCPIIKNCIQKCMTLAYNNVQATGKRFFIAIDPTVKMDEPCLANKNISGLEAALAFTLSILRTEKDVTVAVFKEKEVQPLNLEKGAQFQENMQKLRDHKCDYYVPLSAVDYASTKKKHVDIFINLVGQVNATIPKELREKILHTKTCDVLGKYRKKVNLPNVKFITWCLTNPRLGLATGDGSYNVLDIAGFDGDVPRIIEAFCKGHFS